MTNAPIAAVARRLFARYRHASGDEVPPEERFRTIVVVGAGASHAACGLPLGRTLAEKVIDGVVEAGIPRQLFDRELDRLAKTTRLAPEDFETKLLVLSKLDPTAVLRVLKEQCDFAHYPNLTYEILAHLMKHGFLDAIINFNFDELLDQAIDEEMSGAERYARIVRDGEWGRELRADGFAFDRPLYIKPHGTISEPASLRFTRDAYFDLPPDMAKLLGVLLHGAQADDFVKGVKGQGPADPSRRRRVCVLVIGHALESFEFNELLGRSPSNPELYVVTLDSSAPEERTLRLPRNMRDFVKDRWIPIHGSPGALDNLLVSMWEEIKEQVAGAYATTRWMCVRDIERHGLIARLFRPSSEQLFRRELTSKSNLDERKAIKTYLNDRLVVEAALAVAKAKGFIDIRELYRGRTGRFYRKLCELRGPKPLPLSSYLKDLGMQQRDSSRESFWHQSVSQSPAGIGRPTPRPLTVNRHAPDTMCDHLLSACKRKLSRNRLRKLKGGDEQRMRDTLRAMVDGDDVELVAERRTRWQFVAADPVRTFAELRRKTHELLENRFELLLCVAEAGNWLVHPDFRERFTRLPIGVVVADPVSSEELGCLKCARSMWLPWHLHNRHMTIPLVRDKRGRWKANGAIWFERRYRAASVSPVVLKDAADLEHAMDDFTVYWLKAERLVRNESEILTHDRKALRKERKRIIREIYSGCSQRARP